VRAAYPIPRGASALQPGGRAKDPVPGRVATDRGADRWGLRASRRTHGRRAPEDGGPPMREHNCGSGPSSMSPDRYCRGVLARRSGQGRLDRRSSWASEPSARSGPHVPSVQSVHASTNALRSRWSPFCQVRQSEKWTL